MLVMFGVALFPGGRFRPSMDGTKERPGERKAVRKENCSQSGCSYMRGRQFGVGSRH